VKKNRYKGGMSSRPHKLLIQPSTYRLLDDGYAD
jgi:hypothetical protein